MTIYVDIIFLENLLMNYIIIYAVAIITKSEIKMLKILLSSIIGSVYAILTYTSALEIYSNFILKIMLSITMVYIAFNAKTLKIFLKQLVIFYLTSFTFGGVAFALLYFINTEKIFRNGVLIGAYPIKIAIAGGFIGFIIITTAFKNIKGKINKKDLICQIKIKMNSKYVYVKSIIDTGNFLKEPISKIPVIVVEKESLKEVIDSNLLNNLSNIIKGENVDINEYLSKIRLIPFSSLGKENGMLIGIKADEIMVYREEENIYIKDAIIGIYEGILSKSKQYNALIGLEALGNNAENIYEKYKVEV